MLKLYNKLVRDRIPEIIEADNHKPKTRIMDEAEYIEALLVKLVEEANELVKAKDDDKELAKEIGGVYEVLNAIIEHYKLDRLEIMQLKEKRKDERGGFEKRIFLESVEEKE
jgi:predicted house-cleaning noncanonical NTP pyrophosphatase (MazG superfamily)